MGLVCHSEPFHTLSGFTSNIDPIHTFNPCGVMIKYGPQDLPQEKDQDLPQELIVGPKVEVLCLNLQ